MILTLASEWAVNYMADCRPYKLQALQFVRNARMTWDIGRRRGHDEKPFSYNLG